MYCMDFPGSPVVKILHSNAGGAGSIPGQGPAHSQPLRTPPPGVFPGLADSLSWESGVYINIPNAN